MRYNTLGKTGLQVSEFCLGTMTFGEPTDDLWSAVAGVDQSTADRMVDYAFSYGVNFFDSANAYCDGMAERMLGRSLKSLGIKRQDIVLSSTLIGFTDLRSGTHNPSRAGIVEAVKGSLSRLQTDYLDIYTIQDTAPLMPIDELLQALDTLVSEGLVRHIGVSDWQTWRISKALGISARHGYHAFGALQAQYSLANREIERETVPMLAEEGLGLVAWSPLAGGLLSGKYGPGAARTASGRRDTVDFPQVDVERAFDCVAEMREIAMKHDVSVAEVALAYVLAKPFVTSVAMGARDIAQLERNLSASELTLDEDDLDNLDGASALSAEYPAWPVELQSGRRPLRGILKSA
ncbi:aldo/keto reductase [Rhizobium halophytocola]|uniref:Aryl-alcohol dehydrogenase-like predicted oxidoreductase n=1 Tax=Rhizobium halophytocola TaxID=735519 RepID=A0ABS4E0N0_9HYPH|nr:aldo/keto reductase [Rhizobium halophytocola]MBP1851500.1 aryl-alcohol dehydrogenase-like predicted oxidoreductase [Rhizobium halophytocola]